MRKAILLLPFMLVAAATPAYAQVSGRAELKVGYDDLRSRVVIDRTIRPQEFGADGLTVGAELGADLNAGGLVFGLYGGIDLSKADGCADELFFEFDRTCLESKRNVYGGARAGLRVSDSGLVYIKGGLSRGRLRGSYDDGEGLVLSERDSVNGVHFGGGIELDVARNLYVKGEYIQTLYKDAFGSSLDDEQEFDTTRHQLLFGIGLRFGGPSAPPPPPPPVMAPPPPPPVATQSCPDGSVILATEVCPPPPPPPAPPQAPTSGERG